jgi:large subunit ribosomal protein L17
MRHRKRGRQLGRNTQHRRALYRNLVTSLIDHERIETTVAKAKEIRGITDKMISLGKKNTLASRRRAAAYLLKRDTVGKLFSEIAPRMAETRGGFTRIIKTRVRPGDGASMAVIELTKLGIVKKREEGEESKVEKS